MERTRYLSMILFLLQGLYLMVGALWQLFHMQSFLGFTQLETDSWLLRVSGVLLAAIASCLLLTYFTQKYALQITVLSIITCAGMMYMDGYYYYHENLPLKVYTVDFFIQAFFTLCWVFILSRHIYWRNRFNLAQNRN